MIKQVYNCLSCFLELCNKNHIFAYLVSGFKNGGNRNYEHDYKRSTERLLKLGFIERTYVDFFAANGSRYPVDLTYIISDIIFTEADDFGFIIYR